MVDTERSDNLAKMGAFAFAKHERNGSTDRSPSAKQMKMGSKIYKLSINIEKIRPKPCPKSKKSARSTETTRSRRTITGLDGSTTRNLTVSSSLKTVACKICDQVLQSAQSLYLHKKKQHCRICDICHAQCATKMACEDHRKSHETNDPVLPYKCNLCSEKFVSKKITRLHVRANHDESKIVESETRMTGQKIVSKLTKNDKISAGNYPGVVFTCKVCGKEFTSVEAAEAHTIDHTEIVEEEHKCGICKKLFITEISLNDHLTEHLSRALRCPACPKVFINRATLRIHMKSHGHG